MSNRVNEGLVVGNGWESGVLGVVMGVIWVVILGVVMCLLWVVMAKKVSPD